MSFDTWATACIADELNAKLGRGRVQQVVQVDAESLAFEIYAGGERHYLLASANRQQPRLHRISTKPRRGVDAPSPMLQLLRKFVRGGALIDVYQPPWERVLFLEFQHPEAGPALLVAELIGRWANLLLVRPAGDDGVVDGFRILACIHRVRPADPAARRLLPGQLYQPPPPQAGLAPDQLTELRLRTLLEAAEPATLLWRALVDGLLGFSPTVAREIVFRATGDTRTAVADVQRLQPLLAAVAELVELREEGRWQPGVIMDEAGKAVAFSPFPLMHRTGPDLARWQPSDSLSEAAERYHEARSTVPGDGYAVARSQVTELIGQARQKLERRQDALKRELRSPAEIEQLRVAGEWILALSTQIAPRQAELDLRDAGVDGEESIRLDPALSPADNAAAYFKRYRKAKRAGESAHRRLAAVAADLAYLDQLEADLALATGRDEIDAVRAALAAAGFIRQRKSKALRPGGERAAPHRFTSREGFAILVGRNSQQNEQVTFRMAAADDLWLHAREWPGSHVVIRSGGRPVSDETVQQAAALAAYHSRARNEAWVDVIVTERRHVRRAPGKRPGMVTFQGGRTVRVRPATDPADR